MFFVHGKMAKAFAYIDARSTENRRQKNFLRGMIKRMLHLKQSAAWEKWQAEALHGRDQKERVRLALARMLNRKLSMAFEQWQSVHIECVMLQAREEQAIHEMGEFNKGLHFSYWVRWRGMSIEYLGDDSWEEYREAIGKAGKDRREEIVTKRNQQKRAARASRGYVRGFAT